MDEKKDKEKKDEKKEEQTSDSLVPGDEKKDDQKKSDESPDKKEDKKEEAESDGVDYKAELEKAEAHKKNLELALKNERDINKKLKKGSSQDDDQGDDGQGTTATTEDIQEIFRRENEKARLDFMKDIVDETVTAASSNEDEKALILFHYNNTLNKSGTSRKDIIRDIERAKLLANAPKLRVTLSEAKRKLESETTKNKKGSPSGQKADDDFDPTNLSDADRALMKRHGLSAADIKPRT